MSNHRGSITEGGWESFPTTHWTEILDASLGDEAHRQAALEEMLRRYWKPVYCYLRSKGHPHEAAQDLTQGFFHEVVLGRGLIQKANRARGRFRTFLLAALKRYAVSIHRVQVAKQRMPEGGLLRLEGLDRLTLPEPAHCATPVEIFDYAWASALLDQVIAEVGSNCRERGNLIHWELFRARVLEPIMGDNEPASIAQLCEKYGITQKVAVSKMVFGVKRLFRAVLRRHVRVLVGSDDEVDEEVCHFMRTFSGKRGKF